MSTDYIRYEDMEQHIRKEKAKVVLKKGVNKTKTIIRNVSLGLSQGVHTGRRVFNEISESFNSVKPKYSTQEEEFNLRKRAKPQRRVNDNLGEPNLNMGIQ